MQPQATQTQMIISTIASHAVSSVDLMPSASQPAGATGDACLYTVNFSDETLPVNIKLADLKNSVTAYSTQATNQTNNAEKSTAASTKMASVVAMVATS